MTDHHPATTSRPDEIAIDLVIVHGTPDPGILHALHITGYTHAATTPDHTTYARIHRHASDQPERDRQ
jgi:hypothetical protein